MPLTNKTKMEIILLRNASTFVTTLTVSKQTLLELIARSDRLEELERRGVTDEAVVLMKEQPDGTMRLL